MGAAKKLIDKKVLRNLVPINALSPMHLDEISRKAIIEDVRAGTYVFKKGDRDAQTVYLLDGQVEIIDGREVVEMVTAGSDVACHPLAHKQPRQLGARAAGTVTVARVDSSLLDVLLTWDESAGYDVVEIDAQDDDDWMTRMLQSQAFLQLPPSNIHQLLMRLEAVTANAGEVIVRQGDEGDFFYIVKSGRLAVNRKASPHSKEVLLAELGEGACFGEEALVSGTKRNASVTMITDGTLMRLSKKDFDDLLCASLVHEADFEGAQKLAAKGAKWLDVRLPGEYENRAIKGSINLPLSALRERCSELDRDTNYIVCCDTGRRSAAGAFVLSQRGFNVYALKNGLMDLPEDALTAARDKRPVASGRDADVIRFETEGRPDSLSAANDNGDDPLDEPVESDLIDRLAAAENEKLALQQQLAQVQVRLGEAESRVRQGEAREQEHQSSLSRLQQELAQLGARVGERDRQIEQQNGASEQQRADLQNELAAVRKELEASRGRLQTANDDKDALQRELTQLEQSLSQLQQSAEGRDAVLRHELEQIAGRAETEQERYETHKQELEAELGRVRDDYQQLDQRTSAVAAERDAATCDLQQLQERFAALQCRFDSGLAEDREALESLKQTLNDREQALEAERAASQGLKHRLDELEGSYQHLQQQLSAACEVADTEKSQTAGLTGSLQELQRQHQATETALQSANQQVEVLREQLQQSEQQAGQQLEQQRAESVVATEQLSQRIAHLQQQLEETGGETGAERDALAQRVQQLEADLQNQHCDQEQLQKDRDAVNAQNQELVQRLADLQHDLLERQSEYQAAERRLAEKTQQEQRLQEELAAQHTREEDYSGRLQQQAEQAAAALAGIDAELTEVRRQHEAAEQRNAALQVQLTGLVEEHKSDLASTHQALSRAQTETDNVQREQRRLMKSLRKAERNLERERQEHEAEVYRLRRELKEAAGESSAGLAAEFETLQNQLKEGARARDDLEIKLGERSTQLEDVQAAVEKLNVQLRQAQDSARQAEQQLLETNQAANEEMAVRMEAEGTVQQALRDELAAVIAERNHSQEQLTVQLQELDELRAAVERARQEAADHESSQQALLGLQQERDEELQRRLEAQQQLDQLRAEAEVTRGLVDMQTSAGGDAALRGQLEQAQKNVDVAVRLRCQAEEKNAKLEADIARLRTQLQDAALPSASHIRSLDENDPQAATVLNPDYPDRQEDEPRGATLLIDEDESYAVTPATSSAVSSAVPATPVPGGRVKSLVGGVVIAALALGGAVWWALKQSSPLPDAQHDAETSAGALTPGSATLAGTGKDAEGKPQIKRSEFEASAPTAVVQQHVKTRPEAESKAVSQGAVQQPGRIPDFANGSSPNLVKPVSGAQTAGAKADAQKTSGADGQVAEDTAAEPPRPQKRQPIRTYSEPLSSGGRAPTVVEFQADSFQMGSGISSPNFDERPRHRVDLQRFAISRDEVTFAEYDQFARASGRSLPRDHGWGRGERPVINVRWRDALAYTQWLSEQTGSRYRLPTEAEWEFAARAGSDARFWWGNEVGDSHANCFDCGGQWAGVKTAPVGSFPASSFAVRDMAGNVMEWVQDCYQPDYTGVPADGSAIASGDCSRRVVRGGGYDSPSESLRSASRDARAADTRLDNLGFRVVKE